MQTGAAALQQEIPTDNVWLITIEAGVVIEERLYPYSIGEEKIIHSRLMTETTF